MPGFDGSGPQGMGPMTGGARGDCNPAAQGYSAGYGPGRRMAYGNGFRGGFGRGRGFRRGFGPGFYPPVYPPAYGGQEGSELKALKAQASALKNTLEELNRRISELENVSA